MSTAESSWTKRSSSMRFSSSATGCSNSRKVVFTGSVFYGNRVEGAPQVPSSYRTPGAPALPQLPHSFQRNFSIFEIRKPDALLQSQVVEGEDVRPQQVEHQEHLGRPATDPADLDQL